MKVSEIGQFGLIHELAKMIEAARDERQESWRNLIVGIGDDCAVWKGTSRIQLAHVDCQVEGVHFRPEFGSWEELGWKALAVITSDIAAKGGSPRYALVSLTIPESTELQDITDFYRGMLRLAKEFGIAIVGGHISRASLFTATVSIHGEAEDGILLRASARAGDRVAVTGYLGGAAAYVEMLDKKLKFDEKIRGAFKNAFLHPVPRVAEGKLLVSEGIRTAMDISDGIISDLGHILRASRVSARIDVIRLPVLPELRQVFGDKARELALGGGEDYELLFTGSEDKILRVKAKSMVPVTVIGEITPGTVGEITLLDERGRSLEITRTGWNHFAPH